MDDKVIVTSMVNGITSLKVPTLNFRKVWQKKGAKLPIEKAILREIIYDPGVENMFRGGILYIDDMAMKIELGLEEAGTEVPTLVVPVDEDYLNRLLRTMPLSEMKQAISDMSDAQKQELIDYACKQQEIKFNRAKVIKELCGVDILKVIELNAQEVG